MHKREWIEPYHGLLIPSGPEQNYVEVERDFSDLESKMLELLADPTRASANVFRDRFLSPAAQACYWRRMIESWATVSFVPEGWEVVRTKGKETRKLRGVPFESFAYVSPCGSW